jgi:hypothetical protein
VTGISFLVFANQYKFKIAIIKATSSLVKTGLMGKLNTVSCIFSVIGKDRVLNSDNAFCLWGGTG